MSAGLPALSAPRAWGAVGVLLLIYAFAFIDRQLLSLLVRPLRSDLRLDDVQIGLLQGLAMAMFYAVLGAPLGAWVDRGHRPRILALGVAVWSLFTVLSGLAHSFSALFACRVMVGVGEASVAPVTYSLVSDYFAPEMRGRALGVFGVGVYLGSGAALIIGGPMVAYIAGHGALRFDGAALAPWRTAFLVAGAPGVLLAVAALGLPEPTRAARDRSSSTGSPASARLIRGRVVAIALQHLTTAALATALYAALAWGPDLLRRRYGLGPGPIGLAFGTTVLTAGVSGVLSAGFASDALLARGVASARLLLLAAAGVAAVPLCVALVAAPDARAFLLLMGGAVFFISMLTALGPAGATELYPAHKRGLGAALFQFAVTAIGLGVGPSLPPLIAHAGQGASLEAGLSLTMAAAAVLAAVIGFAGVPAYRRAVTA